MLREPKDIKIGIADKTLAQIIEDHNLWLSSNHSEGEQAVLRCVDLHNADLHNVVLSEAQLNLINFSYSDLSGATLSSAFMSGCHFDRTTLAEADLSASKLVECCLFGADLENANLTCIEVYDSDLSHADLSNSKISNSMFADSTLCGANLCYADLDSTKFVDTDIMGASAEFSENLDTNICLACPSHGAFIGWKKGKLCSKNKYYEEIIIKLKIPKDAKRSSATTNVCRANKVKVLEIQDLEGNTINVKKASSFYKDGFEYQVGKTIEVANFNENRWAECGTGIHFFINRNDAVDFKIVRPAE